MITLLQKQDERKNCYNYIVTVIIYGLDQHFKPALQRKTVISWKRQHIKCILGNHVDCLQIWLGGVKEIILYKCLIYKPGEVLYKRRPVFYFYFCDVDYLFNS
jgi:hypothetical protein